MRNINLIQDEDFNVFLSSECTTLGEIIIESLHHTIFEEFSDELSEKLFQIANKLSSVLFDSLQCHGTNLLIQNGVPAGQEKKNFCLRIIPRFENDSLKLEWNPNEVTPDSLDSVQSRFSDVEQKEKQDVYLKKQQDKVMSREKEVIKDDKENYLLRALRRNP